MVIKIQFYNIALEGAISQRPPTCPSGRVVKAMPCYCNVIVAKALGFTCAGSNPVCDALFRDVATPVVSRPAPAQVV